VKLEVVLNSRSLGERGKSWEMTKFVLRTKFEVLTAALMKIKAVGVFTPCLLVVSGVSKEVPAYVFKVCQLRRDSVCWKAPRPSPLVLFLGVVWH
jgi:hypothetical protein